MANGGAQKKRRFVFLAYDATRLWPAPLLGNGELSGHTQDMTLYPDTWVSFALAFGGLLSNRGHLQCFHGTRPPSWELHSELFDILHFANHPFWKLFLRKGNITSGQ